MDEIHSQLSSTTSTLALSAWVYFDSVAANPSDGVTNYIGIIMLDSDFAPSHDCDTASKRRSRHHPSSAQGLGYFFINNLAAFTSAMWWFLFRHEFFATLEDFIDCIHRRTRFCIDFVIPNKLSVPLPTTDYYLLSLHPILGGCAV